MPSTERRLELKAKDIDGSDRLTAGCVLINVASPSVSQMSVYAKGLMHACVCVCVCVYMCIYIYIYICICIYYSSHLRPIQSICQRTDVEAWWRNIQECKDVTNGEWREVKWSDDLGWNVCFIIDLYLCCDCGGCEPTDVTNFVVPPGKWLTSTISYLGRYYIMRDSYVPTYSHVSFLDLKFRCHQVSICSFGRLLTTTAICIYNRNSWWLRV